MWVFICAIFWIYKQLWIHFYRKWTKTNETPSNSWISFFDYLKPTIMINSPVPLSAPFLVRHPIRIIVFYFCLFKTRKNQMIHKMKLSGYFDTIKRRPIKKFNCFL
jgi:hypothetical protein